MPAPSPGGLSRGKASATASHYFIALLLGGCSRSPRLEAHKTGVVSSPQTFGLGNFTTVRVDPAGKSVSIDWKGYNIKSGNALRVPYEQVHLSSGPETYLVSTKGARNDELIINGKPLQFDSRNKHVLIRFGSGITIENGGDYPQALNLRNPSSLPIAWK